MKIFVLNSGSSSMKCSLYDMPTESTVPFWKAHAEWGSAEEEPSLQVEGGVKKRLLSTKIPDILREVLETLPTGMRSSIDAIGHRIVHGGASYTKSTEITEKVIEAIAHLSDLAPLHNEADIAGIRALQKLVPNVPQVAVFDTAFHHTLPPEAKMYPVPYAWYEEGLRRYGFHGTNFQYCSRKARSMVKKSDRMVICHLGSGASLCAVQDGRSMDTTMGFTPLEGLMMDTRSGSIDPGLLLYRLKKNTKEEIYHALYRESGLLGVSGFSSDMRDILAKKEENERARMAFSLYIHRLVSSIGSMIASLQGLDVLVFTAGIGENASLVREKVCEALSFLGVQLDVSKNNISCKLDCDLSLKGSKIKVLLIHAEEAFEIARESWFVAQKIRVKNGSSAKR